MIPIGRYSFTLSEDYKFEYLFLKNLPNRSEFICKAIHKFISNDENLLPIEKFLKTQIKK